MDLDAIVLVKPKVYECMGKSATEELLKADQRVLSIIKDGIIDKGEKQLISKTTYTNKNLPDESPKPTPDFTYDEIKFGLVTNVSRNNPPYQTAFDKITGFLEVMANDWKQGVRKDGVRTYEAEVVTDGQKTYQKAPFVKWDYLMWNVLWYVSRVTELGVTNQIKEITAPAEMDKMDIGKLAIPVKLAKDFDIARPGAAKIWYLARRFYNEVSDETVAPPKAEMVARTGVTIEEMPEKTRVYLEQFENLLYRVQSIPSPRREPNKTLNRLYMIPERTKPKGSTALPVVPSPENYQRLLEEYRPILPVSLKRWKNLDGNIGELVVFHYGIEHEPKVQEQFPFLPQFQLKRYEGKMFVCMQAVYDRMKALEENYKVNRLLRVHSVVPIV